MRKDDTSGINKISLNAAGETSKLRGDIKPIKRLALIKKLILATIVCIFTSQEVMSLPSGFVYLKNVAPTIKQEMRYASSYNFVGRRINGYYRAQCILSRQAALALAKVQKLALKKGYSLKVYDCYRPQRAVNDFYRWSQSRQRKMKTVFYPREDKATLFSKGYIAKYSGHSRGSTVDLTLVKINGSKSKHHKSQANCYAPYHLRVDDDSINMGTNYDCLDKKAHYHSRDLSKQERHNRALLRRLMNKGNFYPYSKEWWHFTLRAEPYRRQYFNFPIK